jgi:twitching motility protein PilU
MLNSRLTAELIEQGDFSGVKEAMNNSLAEGSQTFEHDIARLITEGQIDRKEGIAHADSPTNLLWRLQNDFSKQVAPEQLEHRESDERGPPSRKSRWMSSSPATGPPPRRRRERTPSPV